MGLNTIAAQGVPLLLGAVGGGVLGGVVSWFVAKKQLKAMQDQLEEAKRQFRAVNTPDVEVIVYFRGKPPEEKGLRLKVTNHHPTITVNDLRVYAVGDSPSKKDAFTFMFLTFYDLKPMQSLDERSPQDVKAVLEELFPDYDSSGAFISEKPTTGNDFTDFPMKVHFSYQPRLHGAPKIEGTKNVYFTVMRSKSA